MANLFKLKLLKLMCVTCTIDRRAPLAVVGLLASFLRLCNRRVPLLLREVCDGFYISFTVFHFRAVQRGRGSSSRTETLRRVRVSSGKDAAMDRHSSCWTHIELAWRLQTGCRSDPEDALTDAADLCSVKRALPGPDRMAQCCNDVQTERRGPV